MQPKNDQNPTPGTPASAHLKEESDALKSKTGDVRDQAKQKAHHAYDELREGTRNIARDSGSYIKSIAVEQQHCLVEKLGGYRDALKAASDQLESEDDTVAAKNIRKAASGLERVTDYLREREPNDLLSDASDLARKHPELVFGGLFLVGLGMARVVKTSARKRRLEEHSANRGPAFGHDNNKPSAAPQGANWPTPTPAAFPGTPAMATGNGTSTPTHHE